MVELHGGLHPNNPYVPNVLVWSSPFSELKGRGFSANFVQNELEKFAGAKRQNATNFPSTFALNKKQSKENAVDFTKVWHICWWLECCISWRVHSNLTYIFCLGLKLYLSPKKLRGLNRHQHLPKCFREKEQLTKTTDLNRFPRPHVSWNRLES